MHRIRIRSAVPDAFLAHERAALDRGALLGRLHRSNVAV